MSQRKRPLSYRDAGVDIDAGDRLVAVKNVSVNEDFTQGHYPGTPLMPAVLMIEAARSLGISFADGR